MVDAPGQRDKDRGRTAEGDRRDAVQGCVAAATAGHVDQPQAAVANPVRMSNATKLIG